MRVWVRLGLVVRRFLSGAGLLLVVGLLSLSGGAPTAQAQGVVYFDIDMDITGNSANTLGWVDRCAEVNDAHSLDGVADYFIDIVVTGDTEAPTQYDAEVIMDQQSPDRVDVVSVNDTIKLPGAFGFSEPMPNTDGTFHAAAGYVSGGPGIPGDGTLVRVGLDIDGTSVYEIGFALSGTTAGYLSGIGIHPVTVVSEKRRLVINNYCGSYPVDLSVDSQVTAAPTDLVVNQDGTLSVSTTGTHTGVPLPDAVGAMINHTVSAPDGCTVDGGASASDSWAGILVGGDSHVLSTGLTIRCSEPGSRVFPVEGDITLDRPLYIDPVPTNDTDTENVSVNVWLSPDTDGDGVFDSDNCPLIHNPDQIDTDSDGQGDACDADDDNDTIVDTADNCPLVSNPNQEERHVPSNGLGDHCEDADLDAFSDHVELWVGTDPDDACPDSSSDDAWPLDIDVSTTITLVGDVLPYSGNAGKSVAQYPQFQRLDLDGSGSITVTGDVLQFAGNVGRTCS